MAFRVLIIGGTGQVGAAVVRALAAEPSCAEVVMVNRRAISLTADPRVRQVILETADAQVPEDVTKLAHGMVAQGDPVYGASCVGVGKGSMKWSEEELKALEIGVVGGFARGCHAGGITQFALLSAAGSTARSRIRYVRVMGLKEETVQGIGFKSLAIFRPGIIAGMSVVLSTRPEKRGSSDFRRWPRGDRQVPRAPLPGTSVTRVRVASSTT